MVMERRTGDVRTPGPIGSINTDLWLSRLEEEIEWRRRDEHPGQGNPKWLDEHVYSGIRREMTAALSHTDLFAELTLIGTLKTMADKAEHAPFDPDVNKEPFSPDAQVFFRSSIVAATILGSELAATGFDFDTYLERHTRTQVQRFLPHASLTSHEEAVDITALFLEYGKQCFAPHSDDWQAIMDRHPLLFNGFGSDSQLTVEAGVGHVIGVLKVSMERPYQSHLDRLRVSRD